VVDKEILAAGVVETGAAGRDAAGMDAVEAEGGAGVMLQDRQLHYVNQASLPRLLLLQLHRTPSIEHLLPLLRLAKRVEPAMTVVR
jgi:hypothetical protein